MQRATQQLQLQLVGGYRSAEGSTHPAAGGLPLLKCSCVSTLVVLCRIA